MNSDMKDANKTAKNLQRAVEALRRSETALALSMRELQDSIEILSGADTSSLVQRYARSEALKLSRICRAELSATQLTAKIARLALMSGIGEASDTSTT